MTILLILFLVCLVVLAWFWDCRPAVRGAEPDPVAPTPRLLDGRPSLDPAMEHHTEHDFLNRLIGQDVSEASRQLQDRLAQARRDERCIRRAMFLMAGLFVLSLAGLCYCAILLPDIFRNPGHLVMRGLGYLGLGSLISQGVFLGYLLWHRVAVSRLRRECRRQVLTLAQSQLKPSAAPSLTGGETQSPGEVPIPCA